MLRIGESINGTYQVLREIGKGGTGVVYLAWHHNLQKYVVIKRILVNFGDMESLRAETDILKNLHHTNLPQMYDFIMQNGEVFTVMDYIEGNSLDHYVYGANQLPEKVLVSWFVQLADVLVYLHSRKPPVFHSDIKPGNVILTPQGTVVLIDFNISLADRIPGHVIGYSRVFASPEQAALSESVRQGVPGNYALDERTDIYSLGALFYYLASGIRPDCFQVMQPLAEMPGLSYSSVFLQVIDKCVKWNRNERYSSARKLYAALTGLKKTDARYRRYTLLRGASWIASALLAAAGSYCLIHGSQELVHEHYYSDYQELSRAVQTGDAEMIEGMAETILNQSDYRRILKEKPEECAGIYHAVGDVHYGKEEFTEAAEEYEAALQELDQKGSGRGRYYCDYAMALFASGNTEDAEQIIREAEAEGAGSAMMLLLRAKLCETEGDYEECYSAVSQILEESKENDPKTAAHACRIAASAALKQQDTDRRLEWLRAALAISQTADDRRELAAALLSKSEDQELSSRSRESFAEEAAEHYQTLCSIPYPNEIDRINLGIALYASGDYEACIKQMDAVTDQNQYEIPMYRAFAYAQLQYYEPARKECKKAIELYEDAGGASSDLEMLKVLQKKLGEERM